MRTGAGVDAVAVAALVLPLLGLLAPLPRSARRPGARPPVARWGRNGALASAVLWVGLLVAHGAPELGEFQPDGAALAAAAGAALVAAGLATESRRRVAAIATGLAAPAAAAVALAVGVASPPTDLDRAGALALAAAGAMAAAVVAALAHAPGDARVVAVALPALLLTALRGAAELPGTDPPVLVPVVLAFIATAVALAAATSFGDGFGVLAAGFPAGSLALWSIALAAGPLASARPAAALLAAAAVLLVAGGNPAGLVAALPGAAVAASAFADVPVASPPPLAAHLLLAALLAGTVVALAAAAVQWTRAKRAPEVVVAVAGLIGWLVVAPGSWWWAVGEGDAVRGWDRAAPTAVAAAAVVVLGVSAWRLRDRGHAVAGV